MHMRLKGSFTVEASLIFPIISFVLVISLFISIYLHDIVCLQNIADLAILEAKKTYEDSNYYLRLNKGLYFKSDNNEDIKNAIDNYIFNQAQNLLIMKSHNNMAINVDIKLDGFTRKIEISILNKFISTFNPKVRAEGKLIQSTSFIKTIDTINDLSDSIGAIKDIKDRYYELLKRIENIIYDWI